jgi:hypothetical protein
MNKEIILDCYFNEISQNRIISSLSTTYPTLFTLSPTDPENLNPIASSISSESSNVSKESSAYETLSFCSDISLLTVDESIVKDVLENRSLHRPFTTMGLLENSKTSWAFVTKEGDYGKAKSSKEMDNLFHAGRIGNDTVIKSCQDTNYGDFRILLKKYCRLYQTGMLLPGVNLIEPADNMDGKMNYGLSVDVKVKVLGDIDNVSSKSDKKRSRVRTNSLSPKRQKKFNQNLGTLDFLPGKVVQDL